MTRNWHNNCSNISTAEKGFGESLDSSDGAENILSLNISTERSGFQVNKRMTITEVADIVGISPKTIVRWEKVGKVRRAKRDWRGWRVYDQGDLDHIKRFRETIVDAA